MSASSKTPAISTLRAGLTSSCPRCGEGNLFTGFLTVAPKCDRCGQDFSFADSGDGPAIFIMLIAGFIVITAALMVEVFYQPPYWVHAALWLPLTACLSIGLLRPFKAMMIALQFRHKAAEGKLSIRQDHIS